mmetsp:Transcript_39159/g.71748  ORF Transcript_39159/g.71748 Transcript_39159/m.71748 type:complete len:163 (+) Transcript_39159:433-921(+)
MGGNHLQVWCGQLPWDDERKEDRGEDDGEEIKKLLLEAKARVQRDKKFLQSVVASEKERLYLTGPFVLGADAEMTEMVAGGPKEKHRPEAQGIFLWRNASAGSDFSSRYLLEICGSQKWQEGVKAESGLSMLSAWLSRCCFLSESLVMSSHCGKESCLDYGY